MVISEIKISVYEYVFVVGSNASRFCLYWTYGPCDFTWAIKHVYVYVQACFPVHS